MPYSMGSFVEKSSDDLRALLFGLLINCIFSSGAKVDCPLWDIRNNLTNEEKHGYVMGLSLAEIKKLLATHEECFEKRWSEMSQFTHNRY